MASVYKSLRRLHVWHLGERLGKCSRSIYMYVCMYMYVYVCMYVCMYVYIYIYIFTKADIYTNVCTHAHTKFDAQGSKLVKHAVKHKSAWRETCTRKRMYDTFVYCHARDTSHVFSCLHAYICTYHEHLEEFSKAVARGRRAWLTQPSVRMHANCRYVYSYDLMPVCMPDSWLTIYFH